MVDQVGMDLHGTLDGVNGLPLTVQVVDNADNPKICDIPYQFSLLTQDGLNLATQTPLVDVTKWSFAFVSGGTYAERVFKAALAVPTVLVIGTLGKLWHGIAQATLASISRAAAAIGEIAGQELLLRAANFLCLGSLRKFVRIQQYQADFTIPIGLPTPSEAASGWLGGEIDECTFQTYVKSGDTKYPPYKAIAMSGKWKFSALELIALYKRGGISRADISTRLRELGSLYPEDQSELEALFQQLPGPSDIIRFMVRDTQNAAVVADFGLDSGFTDNYTGILKEWAQKQGVPDEVMQNEWRAHWSIPSPTQLYEMLHRLRDDPRFGGAAKVLADIKEALKQQDILPYWIDKLIAVSYHPLTRTDLFRAYERGWIDDDAFTLGMHQDGYSDDDSRQLLRFVQQERKLALRTSDFVRAYAEGFTSESQLKEWATREGFEDALIPEIVDEASFRRDLAEQRRVTEAVSQQYRACRITRDEAVSTLTDLGVPQEVIDYQINIVSLKSLCGTRREWQSTLCSLLTAGEITVDQYRQRMVELKYDDMAIDNYLSLCQYKRQKSQAAAQAKAEKQAEQEAQRAARQAQQQERQAQQAAARAAKALATAERSRQSRNRTLDAATNKLGGYLSDVSGPPAELVQGLWHGLQDTYGLSQNEAAYVINSTASKAKGMSTPEYTQWVYETAQAGLAEPWMLYPEV
jgi:hypothetical protein